MSERKKWGGESPVRPVEIEDPTAPAALGHLEALSRRNEAIRERRRREETEEARRLRERERGFDTYLSGANNERIQGATERKARGSNRRAAGSTKRSTGSSNTSEGSLPGAGNPSRKRSTWNKARPVVPRGAAGSPKGGHRSPGAGGIHAMPGGVVDTAVTSPVGPRGGARRSLPRHRSSPAPSDSPTGSGPAAGSDDGGNAYDEDDFEPFSPEVRPTGVQAAWAADGQGDDDGSDDGSDGDGGNEEDEDDDDEGGDSESDVDDSLDVDAHLASQEIVTDILQLTGPEITGLSEALRSARRPTEHSIDRHAATTASTASNKSNNKGKATGIEIRIGGVPHGRAGDATRGSGSGSNNDNDDDDDGDDDHASRFPIQRSISTEPGSSAPMIVPGRIRPSSTRSGARPRPTPVVPSAARNQQQEQQHEQQMEKGKERHLSVASDIPRQRSASGIGSRHKTGEDNDSSNGARRVASVGGVGNGLGQTTASGPRRRTVDVTVTDGRPRVSAVNGGSGHGSGHGSGNGSGNGGSGNGSVGQVRPPPVALDSVRRADPRDDGAPLSPTVELLQERIGQLDTRKRRHLLRLLGRLEEAESDGVDLRASMTADGLLAILGGGRASGGGGGDNSRINNRSSTSLSRDETPEPVPTATSITITARSNWGDPSHVGLTSVEFLYDDVGTGQLAPAHPTEEWGVSGTVLGRDADAHALRRLVNGRHRTVQEKNMFRARVKGATELQQQDEQQQPLLRVTFTLPPEMPLPHSLRVWNYNASPESASAGIRAVDVAVDGQVVWRGECERGCGNQVFDYSQEIPLDGPVLPDPTSTPNEAKAERARPPRVSFGGATSSDEDSDDARRRRPRRNAPLISPPPPRPGSSSAWSESSSETREGCDEEPVESSTASVTGNNNSNCGGAPGDKTKKNKAARGARGVSFGREDTIDTCDGADTKRGVGFAPPGTPPPMASARKGSSSMTKSPGTPRFFPGGKHAQQQDESDSDNSDNDSDEDDDAPNSSFGGRMAGKLGGTGKMRLPKATTTVDPSDAASITADDASDVSDERRRGTHDDSFPSSDGDGDDLHGYMAGTQDSNNDHFDQDEDEQEQEQGEEATATRDSSFPAHDTLGESDDVEFDPLERSLGTLQQFQRLQLGRLRRQRDSRENEDGDEVVIGTVNIGDTTSASDDNFSRLDDYVGGAASFLTGPSDEVNDDAAAGSTAHPDLGPDGDFGCGEPDLGEIGEFGGALCESFNASTLETELFGTGRFALAEAASLDDEDESVIKGLLSQSVDDALDEAIVNAPPVPIPTSPKCLVLAINILSTWGDEHYVGLTGVEVFDASGDPVAVVAVAAETGDVSDPCGGSLGADDPRVPQNVARPPYATRDELHMWLARFGGTEGKKGSGKRAIGGSGSSSSAVVGNHFLYLLLEREVCLGCVRVWNYSSDRVHSARGVRHCEFLAVDAAGQADLVFRGEIRRAFGSALATDENDDNNNNNNDDTGGGGGERGVSGNSNDSNNNAGDNADGAQSGRSARRHRLIGRKKRRQQPLRGPETVLFTTDPDALAHIDAHTSLAMLGGGAGGGSDLSASVLGCDLSASVSLGGAAFGNGGPAAAATLQEMIRIGASWAGSSWGSERPGTAERMDNGGDGGNDEAASVARGAGGRSSLLVEAPARRVTVLELRILSTWGDAFYAGLTGLELVGPTGEAIPVTTAMLDAVPRDMNAIPGHTGDHRVLENLVSGVNQTTDDGEMWLIPFERDARSPPTVRITLPRPTLVSALRVWNYNKSPGDTARGSRAIEASADGQALPSMILRRAPGHADHDFGQFLPLFPAEADTLRARHLRNARTRMLSMPMGANGAGAISAQRGVPRRRLGAPESDFVPPVMPCGTVFEVVVHSTWGDPHYVGLGSLQVVPAPTADDEPIGRGPDGGGGVVGNVRAANVPRGNWSAGSVRDCPGLDPEDPRTVDRLFEQGDEGPGWLAPFEPGSEVRVTFWFDAPVCVAALRACNYGKTPTRGAREIEVRIDGALVYRGELPCAKRIRRGSSASNASSTTTERKSKWHSILFTTDPSIVMELGKEAPAAGADLDVGLWDEGRCLTSGGPSLTVDTTAQTGSVHEPGYGEVRPLTGRVSLKT